MKTENNNVVKKRNYGIDLLRIVAMFMIIALHALGLGGVVRYAEQFSLNYEAAWLLEVFIFCFHSFVLYF